MADLSNVVRMLIHQLDATRSYLLPGYCDEDEKARAVIAFAESALAAQPPAPGPTIDDIWELCEDHEFHLGMDGANEEESAEGLLEIINTALGRWGRPAPAPAADGERDHVPGAGNMVPADGEAGELAQWLEDEAVYYEGLSTEASAKATRAAALLRQPAPAPVPVADRPWERPGWCDADGQCWWGRCADDFFNPEWTMATLANIEEFCSDAMPQHCLPHWAIPQPPQGGEVEP